MSFIAFRDVLWLWLCYRRPNGSRFDDLQETLSSAGEIECQSLIQYYTHTWLNGFERETFCVSGLSDRTNNKIEGWHSRIGGLAHEKRGSHEAIRDLLKSEQHTFEALLV